MQRWSAVGSVLGALGALSAVLVGGCSSAANAYPDVDSFCQAEAAAYCQTGGVVAACGVSQAVCDAAQQSDCVTAANQATATGTRAYNSANVQACIDAVTAAFTSTTPGVLSVPYMTLQQLAQTCDQVFPGSVPLSGACKTSDDCAQGSTPSITTASGATIPGVVCSPVAPGSTTMECATTIAVPGTGTGAECANFGSVCTDPGTYCTGVPAECTAGATMGGDCTATKVCALPFSCSMSAGATKGTCVAPAGISSACFSDEDCASTAPYCDLNVPPKGGKGTGSCELGLSFAVGGDDCNAFGG
jgi:hypothetical protein